MDRNQESTSLLVNLDGDGISNHSIPLLCLVKNPAGIVAGNNNDTGEKLPQPGQNLPQPEQNLPQPGQNLPQPGYSLLQPGQNLPQPGQNLPIPGENVLQPGQTLPPLTQNLQPPGQNLEQSLPYIGQYLPPPPPLVRHGRMSTSSLSVQEDHHKQKQQEKEKERLLLEQQQLQLQHQQLQQQQEQLPQMMSPNRYSGGPRFMPSHSPRQHSPRFLSRSPGVRHTPYSTRLRQLQVDQAIVANKNNGAMKLPVRIDGQQVIKIELECNRSLNQSAIDTSNTAFSAAGTRHPSASPNSSAPFTLGNIKQESGNCDDDDNRFESSATGTSPLPSAERFNLQSNISGLISDGGDSSDIEKAGTSIVTKGTNVNVNNIKLEAISVNDMENTGVESGRAVVPRFDVSMEMQFDPTTCRIDIQPQEGYNDQNTSDENLCPLDNDVQPTCDKTSIEDELFGYIIALKDGAESDEIPRTVMCSNILTIGSARSNDIIVETAGYHEVRLQADQFGKVFIYHNDSRFLKGCYLLHNEDFAVGKKWFKWKYPKDDSDLHDVYSDMESNSTSEVQPLSDKIASDESQDDERPNSRVNVKVESPTQSQSDGRESPRSLLSTIYSSNVDDESDCCPTNNSSGIDSHDNQFLEEIVKIETKEPGISKGKVVRKYFNGIDLDITYPNIYARKVRTFNASKVRRAKKNASEWNQAHACKYCDKVVTDITKHYNKHEESFKELRDIHALESKLGKGHKTVRAMWDMIRNRGDHEHNKRVLETKSGEFILKRRKFGILDVSKYAPCPICLEWIPLDKTLYTHQYLCPGRVEGVSNPRELRIVSLIEDGRLMPSASKDLCEEVLTILSLDDIGQTAVNDQLIVMLGNIWLTKSKGNELNRKYYTSSRMRDVARLLLNLKKESGKDEFKMNDFLTPEHFYTVVKAAFNTVLPNFDDFEDLKYPSSCIQLGYDIRRMTSAKLGLAIKEGKGKERQICLDFMDLMEKEWSQIVTRYANTILQVRLSNEKKPLPEPEDLEKISKFIKEEIKIIEAKLTKPNSNCFRRAVMLVETRLLLYNKRRAGEIEGIRVQQYVTRRCGRSNVNSVKLCDLSELEEKLLDFQEVLETRGKHGTAVPVIVPKDCKKVLNLLANASVRRKAGIRSENPYLFPNSNVGVLRAYDSLKTLCSEMNVNRPEQITSVKIRKYIATITQVLDLSQEEQNCLMNRLGHTLDKYKIYYRQTAEAIERIDVAKIILLQEFSLTAKYALKQLKYIDLDELVMKANGSGSLANKEELGTMVAWTTNELEEVRSFYGENISSSSASGLKECMKLKEQSDSAEGVLLKKRLEENLTAKFDGKQFEDNNLNGTREALTTNELEKVRSLYGENISSSSASGLKECLMPKEQSDAAEGVLLKKRLEENLTGKFDEKQFEDIYLNSTSTVFNGCEAIDSEGYIPGIEHLVTQPDEYIFEDGDTEDYIKNTTNKQRKKRTNNTRVPWSIRELEELRILFRKDFSSNSLPGKKKCLWAKEKSKKTGGVLFKRSWMTIKKKVFYMIQKKINRKI